MSQAARVSWLCAGPLSQSSDPVRLGPLRAIGEQTPAVFASVKPPGGGGGQPRSIRPSVSSASAALCRDVISRRGLDKRVMDPQPAALPDRTWF